MITHVHSQPVAPLTLATIAAALSSVVGVPLAISCDTPDVPSTIDGHTLDAADDGEVWWTNGVVSPIIHVSVDECQSAMSVNRRRDPNPVAFLTYQNKRVDVPSGAALEVMLHEAFHIGLESADEGHVECMTVENAWPLVRYFHLPATVAGWVLGGIELRHAQSTGVYRTEC